ncbi:beta-N-acetylhexosaminidase [Alteromonadaceae bacterium 2753L.S.0a.02]|nr:beta-N-acetylhexosaminidase [Alteromonadaceae bacterium 2753L.S.0a.02]
MTNSLGPVVLDVAGTSLSSEDELLLKNPWVGGLILFSRNYQKREQLCDLVASIKAINPKLLVCVDHEGGRVQRFREGFTRIPAMQYLGKLYAEDQTAALHAAQEVAWLMCAELIACGLDVSFAPVLDIDESFSDIIGDRSFSCDPAVTMALAEAFIAGMHDAGMAATGKHFPGHGGVKADSHLELPVDSRSFTELENSDLVPFQALCSDLEGLMPAHILFPNVDTSPVGFSSYWLREILRKKLGFDGVIFSDDLSMEGAIVAGTFGERAIAALEAGCSSVLVCNNRSGALEVLEALAQYYPQPPESRLETMLARSNLSWHALESSSRTVAARKLAASLNRNN